MVDYPTSGVRLEVLTKDAQSAIDELTSSLDALQGQTYTADVEVTADASEAQSVLEDLPLEGGNVDFTVDAQETDTAKETLESVNVLKNLKIVETVWNIVGTGVDLIQRFGGDLLQPMLDLDDAVARVNAETGNAIPNARTLIHDIFYDDLGESIDQVGELITQAHQIGAPIDEATRAALTFTHTFQDQNPQDVLNTLNQMVVNKLTPDFKTAGDVLVTAFQNGANRGKDLLNALNDNATAIHDMGLTGPEALSFIKTGLDNGFNSATQVLNLLEKIKQNVTNAAGNPTSDVSKTLKTLNIANPAETGEAWSSEFFKSVIDKITNMPGLTDTQREALFSNLAGGKQGGKTFSSFLQLSPEEADTIFANVGGAAERAAKEADNSLTGAFADFQKEVEKKVGDFLSSEAIDIPGKIEALKTGLQNALDTLAAGGTLSEALTVALKPLGFDDEFQGLESALGNFVIAILQAVAAIQDFTGHGAEAEGTRAVIAKQSQTQLAFDLTIANPDEVATDIATATSRGLSNSNIADTVSGVIDKLITDGTADSLAQAQLLIDTLKKPIDQNKLPTLASGAPMNVEPVVTDEAIAALQTKVNSALEKAPQPDTVTELSTTMGLVNKEVVNFKDASKDAKTPLINQTDATKKVTEAAKTATTKEKDLAATTTVVGQNALTADTSLAELSGTLGDFVVAVNNAKDAVSTAPSTPPSDGGTPPDDGGGLPPPPNEGGGPSIQSNFNAVTLGYIPGGSFGRGASTNIVNNNNHVQSMAQADRLGYRTAQELRGV